MKLEESINWIDIKKQKPLEGIRVLACDEYGYVDFENTDSVTGREGQKRTWIEAYEFGNGTKIVAWAPVPKWSKKLCRKDADGEMP